jgi:tol-pal system protein YbgF
MSVQPVRVLFACLALSLGGLLVACATKEDLRSASRDLQNELKDARQRSAELETGLREIKGQDLSQMLGQLETQRRDLDTLLSGLDDQKAQIYSLDQKLATQLTRLQEVVTTVEKKLLERLDVQDQRLGGYEKHAAATDRNVAQVNAKVREVGIKLSTQLDQQATVLARLEEAIKQADLQTGALSAEVKRFQGVLSEFDKVLRALNDKATDVDRRVTELTGRTETKVGTLAPRQGDQAVGAEVPEAIAPGGPGPAAKEPSNSVSPAATAPVLKDKEVYDRAQQQFKQGQYDAALTSFHLFLVQYPKSALVPNAHFWKAECYVRTRDYQRGVEEYEQVIQHYPKSEKAPRALYKKAMALLELKDKDAAKIALRQLLKDYPQSEDFQQARTKLASLK